MFRKDTSTQAKESRQGTSSAVSQYQNLAQNDSAKKSGQVLELTEDSVDFSSVFNTLSESQTRGGTPRESLPGSGHKDLNISSIIERIQDEGPAVLRRDGESRPDQTSSHEKTRVEEAAEVHETANAPAAPTAAEISQLAKSAAEEILSSRVERENAQPSGRFGWVLMTLLFLLAVGGYFLYKTNSELAMARSHITQLSKRLSKTEESLAGLGRQVSGNANRIQAVLTPQGMQKEMMEYQKQILQEVDERLDSMLLTWGGYIPSGPVNQPSKSVLVANPPKDSTDSLGLEATHNRESKPEPSGNWQVYLASYRTEGQAKTALAKYKVAVPEMVVQPAKVKGREVYRLVVPGISSKKKANLYLDEIKKKLGLQGSWIGRHRKD